MKQKILIIEDEIIVANSLQMQLEKEDYTTEIATTPQQAIQLTTEIDFDLVLTDINLNREMDGIELFEHLNLNPSVPVIFLTAYSDQKTISRAEIIQPYSFLLKPFHKEQLLITVKMSLLHSQKKFLHKAETRVELSRTPLSKREMEIVKLICESKTSNEIAAELNISHQTVSTHRKNIFRKTRVKNLIELVSVAVENKWI